MSHDPVDVKTFWHVIKRLINAPDFCQRCVITLEMNQPVRVECTYLPEAPDPAWPVVPITKRYTLTEIED